MRSGVCVCIYASISSDVNRAVILTRFPYDGQHLQHQAAAAATVLSGIFMCNSADNGTCDERS